MPKSSNARRPILMGLAACLVSTLVAQVTPPPAIETPSLAAETVRLNPFVVDTTTDRGYIAVDSLAGGRTNTPIRLTPAAMSSLTRTFIDDLRITNVRDALRWAPNVVPTDPAAGTGFGGAAFHDWSFNYRNAGAGQQGGPGPTRNYFSFYQNADSYNIERIEFVRGPNSLLFGLGTVGGTLSTYTKVPRFDDSFFRPILTLDSHGSVRIEGDLNQVASDRFAVRVNTVFDDSQGWREGDEGEFKALDLALLFQLTDNTTLRLEVEGAQRERTLISSSIGERISGWDGTTASPTWGAPPVGNARTVPIQNAGAWGDWLKQFWVYIPSLEGNRSFMPWAGGYASSNSLADVNQALPMQPYEGWYPDEIKLTTETEYSSTANIPIRPSRDWTYGHGLLDNDYENLTVFLDHEFTENFDISLSFFRYMDDIVAKDYEGTGGAAIDINQQLPDGSPNPNFGKAFADFFLSRQTQSRANTEARAQVNYSFESTLFNAPWNQRFSLSTSTRKLTISARQSIAQIANGAGAANPADWNQDMVWGRLYLDQPNQVMNAPEMINGQRIEYRPAQGYWFDFDDEFRVNDVAFVSHTRLLDDDLSLIAGIRHDRYKESLRELRRGPDFADRFSRQSDSGTTYSVGAVYYFNWLGVFANYAENIQPPNAGSQPLLDATRPGPEEGESFEYGFRVSTDDGKYYATLLRYQSKSVGHLVENPVAIRPIWERYNLAQGRPQTEGFGSIAYSDTTARDVEGYEFELTANPTESIRLQASFGKPEAIVVDYYPGVRAHFAQYLPQWQAEAANDLTLQNNIATAQNTLNQSVPGAIESGSVDYTASIFANYSFLGDFLRGWSIGAGVSRIGERYAGVFSGEEYWGSAVTYTNAVIAYEREFGNVRARFALNIDNVLDEGDPLVTSYHWGFQGRDGRHIRDAYYFQEPRTFRFTAQFTF